MRPAATDIYFLAERPYLPPGSLREVLVPTKPEHSISDGQINALLHELDLDTVLVRAGGLNVEQDWGTLQIGLDAVIIKERVVDIEKKDEVMHRGHGLTAVGFGLCHGPSGPISALASSGPQLTCS